MTQYHIDVHVTASWDVIVEAENPEEAEALARAKYENNFPNSSCNSEEVVYSDPEEVDD